MTSRMFRVLRKEARVKAVSDKQKPDKLEAIWFSKHGFKEVEDLHPWLAYEPGLLGENLLVVASTPHEHNPVPGGELSVDILAVDWDGALVVVEVKRDSSGGEVYWQAARYAAAYWKYTPDQIIDIYTEFNLYNELKRLDRTEAIRRLKKHTGAEDEAGLKGKLNHRQKIVLVAQYFWREDTVSASWLQAHGVDISFLKLTPYVDKQDVEQKTPDKTYYVTGEYVRNPETEELAVDLLKPQRERLVITDVDDRTWVTNFSRSVIRRLKDHVESELMPSETDKSARKMGDFRYFGLWRPESPWYGFYIFVRAPEDDRDLADLMRVTLLFQFSRALAKQACIAEAAIGELRSLTCELTKQPEWEGRKMEGHHEAGKTVHVALDEPGAERAAETLAEVIREMSPRVKGVLDKDASKRLGSGAPE